ncbi:MAG: hypothetical protein AB8H80_01560 [Planctomycetota bacterium]
MGGLALCAGARGQSATQSPVAPGQFRESFDGLGQSSIETFSSPQWEIARHVRAPQYWFQMEPMLAAHGLDTSPPPATHAIDAYDDMVYTARQHMMTAINAESYGVIYLTPGALADFRDGECVIRFDAATLRTTRRDWLDVWLTPMADNMQLPLEEDLPDLQGHPRNALQLRMSTYYAQFPGAPIDWTHFEASRFDDYVETSLPVTLDGYESYITPSPTQRQTFELRVTRTSLRFGIPALNLWWVDTTFADLGYDRAVVQFGHHSYNPVKAGTVAPLSHDTSLAGTADPSPMSWHWDNFEITPALRVDLIHGDRRFVRGSAPQPVRFDRPAPVGSFLRFSALGIVDVAFNGGPFQPAPRQQGSLQAAGQNNVGQFSSYWLPVPEGTDRVDFQIVGEGYWLQINNETLAKDISIWSPKVGGTGCAGTGGLTPRAEHASPQLGSAGFGISLTSALASAPAVLAMSFAEVPSDPCGIAVSLDPAHGPVLRAAATDAAGNAFGALPLPNAPSLTGLALFAQWAVVDPQGVLVAAPLPLAVTPLRRIVLE